MRETETFDTFFDSSWYFLRYASEPLNDKPFDLASIKPTFFYVGGKEHAVLHLFYSRFITHFLNQKGFSHFKEPFERLLMQSVIKGKTYKVDDKYISEEEAKHHKNVVIEYEKMSKSKGNGVNPQELLQKYGSDATRWTLIADGTSGKERLWDSEDKEFGPTMIFMHRVLMTVEEFRDIKSGLTRINGKNVVEVDEQTLETAKRELLKARNSTSHWVLFSIQYNYNIKSATISIFTLIKTLRKYYRTNVIKTIEFERSLAALLIMISPFVPHFSAECWKGFTTYANGSPEYDIISSVFEQKWPTIDDNSFEYKIYFTFADKNGKHVVSHDMKVSRKLLNDWTESDVKQVIDVKEEDIEKIEIIKDVVVIVRLKQCPQTQLQSIN